MSLADTSLQRAATVDDGVSLLGVALSMLVAHQGQAFSIKDASSGRYRRVSDNWTEITGVPAEAVVGHSDAEWLDAASAAALRSADSTVLAQGGLLGSDHVLQLAAQRREFRVTRVLLPARADGSPLLVALWQDRAAERQREQQLRQALEQIEQQQHANDRLRRELADQALRDPATGLHRRAHFEDQLRREVDLSQREHREFAIVFIALDPPAPAVLALGSAGEQAVLEAMGRLLKGGTRAMDAACRYDQRRFAVLLSGVGLATAHTRMEGLRRQCATHIVVHGGHELGFTVAVGVASFPHTAASQDELVLACEAALAEAQRRGGNHVTLAAIRFEPS